MNPRAAQVWHNLHTIRTDSPLVHAVTNLVSMNFTANVLLALGASPVMALAEEEVREVVAGADALVVNIGTPEPGRIAAMAAAMDRAGSLKTPIVFDPVGVAASRYRRQAALGLCEAVPPSVIRGNPSEILAMVDPRTHAPGVDSGQSADSALDAARTLSLRLGCVVVVSGRVDAVVRDRTVIRVSQGDAMMRRVTGMGCAASAVIAAFASVCGNPVEAAAHAMGVMGIAGELAAARSTGPGSFQVNFLDALYGVDGHTRSHQPVHGSPNNPVPHVVGREAGVKIVLFGTRPDPLCLSTWVEYATRRRHKGKTPFGDGPPLCKGETRGDFAGVARAVVVRLFN